jgi:23S rRNA (guanine2445-N2)-methyltransferase / 23S rRNA (guanine2069-N7)-methyltransferase
VLLALGEVSARTPDDLYAGIRDLAWEEHCAPQGTIAIDVVGQGPEWLRHSQFAAQKAKDAIVDRMRDRTGERPSVDFNRPDLRLNLRFGRERATVSIDLSGEPLHLRGYRQSGVEAPLKENLAAALLLRCGWPGIAAGGGSFADPMCGSGTLVIEAALMAANIAPGSMRKRFGFERWLGHQPALWQELKQQAASAVRADQLEAGRFIGSDRDQTAIRAALANANRAGVGDSMRFERLALNELSHVTARPGLVLVNPPYGARIGEQPDLGPLYADLGRVLMECFPGWEAGVFTGNPPLGRELKLRAYRTHTFYNGPIECRLLRFRLDSSAVERDRETVRQERLEAARERPGAAMFANRVRKNLKELGGWAAREGISCFRVYDADMPEYAFAIDIYGNDERWAYVQEYAAPPTVSPEAARSRRDEAMSVLSEVLSIPPERTFVRVRRRQRGGEQYEKLDSAGQFHVVREGGYRLLVNFTDYLDTGMFLDHRLTRQRIGELAKGRRFLNLFAYTGVATVHAVGGGARASTTVDMSRTYLDWAKRNLALNGLAGPEHGFVHADCFKWLEERAAAGRKGYDLVFVDPPTISRSKRMSGDFDVQRDHVRLLELTSRLLERDGIIVFSNNYQRFKLERGSLAAFDVEDITRSTLPRDFERSPRIHQCFVLRPRQEQQA